MIFFKKIFALVFLYFIVAVNGTIHSQQDSLLKKISNLDISLNSADDSDENLYMMSVSFQSFYDELSPVGEWIQISKDDIESDMKDGEGQGFASDIIADEDNIYIWHPTGMSDDWHPYLNGRWVFTTQGWFWASNYHWGWAVYHYGRWWNSPTYGWVWLPGRVWAPAWVRWKITNDYVGWCPLTPFANWKISEGVTLTNYKYVNNNEDWVFIGKSSFTDEVKISNRVSVDKYEGNKAQDILNIKYESSKIMNSGPDVKEIELKTGKTIVPKEINTSDEKTKPIIGDNAVTAYKENFKKLEVDGNTGKPREVIRPSVYVVHKEIQHHRRKKLRHIMHHLKK